VPDRVPVKSLTLAGLLEPAAPLLFTKRLARLALAEHPIQRSSLHPHTRPSRTKKSPAPFYHAATKVVRKAFWQAYSAFMSAFREAADRWREGNRKARFPVGSFPPGLPFVTEEAYSPP
jgi:hypothetical protein